MSDTSLPDYAELHCLSNFSYLRGASHPEELVERAAQLEYKSLAITDECSFAGIVRAHVEAKKHGLHLIIGTEVLLECGLKLILLAMDEVGYANLAEWITLARRRSVKGHYQMHRSDIEFAVTPSHGLDHLRFLPGCYALFVPDRESTDDELLAQADWVARIFRGRAAIAVELLLQADDDLWMERTSRLSLISRLRMAATGHVLMHVRSRKPLQDTLTAIRLGTPLAECGLELQPNAEQHMRQRVRLGQIYPRALLDETLSIAAKCKFNLDTLRYQYPKEIAPEGELLPAYFRRITYEGASERFPSGIPAKVQAQIEHELAIIADLAYEPYFLTVYDIVQFARAEGILCQGRGSAANSAVAYCLGITAVDPSRASVLFERFLSKERAEPPDIDVDFEHERRELVMQYIYEKYGRHRAALTGAITTYRPRSALKDVGKALGMDFEQLNALSRNHQWWDGRRLNPDRMREQGLDTDSPVVQKLIYLAEALIGFPRHLSQHTGGFVIARHKLSRLVPIENAAMENRSVIQWDKDDLDAMGLLKIDVLALGMLTAIRRALDFIAERRGETFTWHDIPSEDAATYELISRADTVGVFQIESRAQMSMLARLQPRCFYDLVIQVAIVRPGPIQGGMVHPYLRRRMGEEPVEYESEEIRSVLERTLGVPIFQEQVMAIAMVAAGFSAGEADQLRRAMAAWKKKGGLDKFYDRLVNGMTGRGYTKEFAERIYAQIHGFSEYGFPESHSASFALLVYVSAWIKCHEPAVFLAALLNSQPMGFYTPSQLIQDAKRHGVEVRPADVMVSVWDCTLEEHPMAQYGVGPQPAVRLGLRLIKGMSAEGAESLVFTRAVRPFDSVDDLARRAQLSTHDLQALAWANALLTLSGHRRQAAWQVSGMKTMLRLLKDAPIAEDSLLITKASEGQEVVADYASMGLTLNRHPLAILRQKLSAMNLSTAEELKRFPDRKLARTTGIVTVRQRPGTANGVLFMTLEDETGNTNVIVWPDLLEKFRREALNAKLLTVYGVMQTDGRVVHLLAKRLVDHSELLGVLNIRSYDFH